MPDPVIPTLAIVGGGASGTLVAIHALAQARAPLAVVLVEARPEVGRGVAYATAHALHRLNVPAGKMSAFPDAPADFLGWLRSGPVPEATAATFAPRGLFGRYLAETLAATAHAAAPGVTLRVIHDTAVAVEPSGAVRLASGETVGASLEAAQGRELLPTLFVGGRDLALHGGPARAARGKRRRDRGRCRLRPRRAICVTGGFFWSG